MEYEAVKDTVKTILAFALMALIALGLYFALFGIGSGRVTVFVKDGQYSTKYKTDKVLNDGPRCIKFRVGNDTIRACGAYTVRY
jgi:hypothetical protein